LTGSDEFVGTREAHNEIVALAGAQERRFIERARIRKMAGKSTAYAICSLRFAGLEIVAFGNALTMCREAHS